MVSIFRLILSHSIDSMILYLCCFNTASAGKWPRHTKKTDGRFCGLSVGAHAYQWSLGWFSLFDWWWDQWVTDHLVWCVHSFTAFLFVVVVFFLYWTFFSLFTLNGSAMLHCSRCSLLSLSSSISILLFLLHFSPVHPPTHPLCLLQSRQPPTYLSRTIFSWRRACSSSDSSCRLTLSGDSTQLYF